LSKRQPDSQFPEIDDEVKGRFRPKPTPRENSKKGNGRCHSTSPPFPNNLTSLFKQKLPRFWQNNGKPTKKPPGWQARPNGWRYPLVGGTR
jgi:hypothetical protein